MKIYSFYGINEFIICLGYKGSVIKEYFINYKRYSADVTLDLQNDEIELHNDIKRNIMYKLKLKEIFDFRYLPLDLIRNVYVFL